jgi:hypothetical protein
MIARLSLGAALRRQRRLQQQQTNDEELRFMINQALRRPVAATRRRQFARRHSWVKIENSPGELLGCHNFWVLRGAREGGGAVSRVTSSSSRPFAPGRPSAVHLRIRTVETKLKEPHPVDTGVLSREVTLKPMGCGSSAVKQDRGAAAQHVPTLCFRGVVHSGSNCKWSFSVLIVSSEGITPVLLVDGSPVSLSTM